MKDGFSKSRRLLLRSSGLLGACGVLANLPSRARAAELPHVDESDKTAVQLKYVHDATKSARTNPESYCHNCRYFKGNESTEWERCDLFPGKSVNAKGWCNVWAKKG